MPTGQDTFVYRKTNPLLQEKEDIQESLRKEEEPEEVRDSRGDHPTVNV